MCLNYTCIIFFFFLVCACTWNTCTCSFVVLASATVAHGIVVLLKKFDILFYEYHVHIFLNFGVISL